MLPTALVARRQPSTTAAAPTTHCLPPSTAHTCSEVYIYIEVPQGVRAKQLEVSIRPQHLAVGIKDLPPYLDVSGAALGAGCLGACSGPTIIVVSWQITVVASNCAAKIMNVAWHACQLSVAAHWATLAAGNASRRWRPPALPFCNSGLPRGAFDGGGHAMLFATSIMRELAVCLPLWVLAQRDLGGTVKPSESYWTLEDGVLNIQLTKAEEGATWASAIAGAAAYCASLDPVAGAGRGPGAGLLSAPSPPGCCTCTHQLAGGGAWGACSCYTAPQAATPPSPGYMQL